MSKKIKTIFSNHNGRNSIKNIICETVIYILWHKLKEQVCGLSILSYPVS